MVRVVMSVFLVSLALFSCSSASDDMNNGYVHSACSVTHYQDLCIRSLSSFSRTAKQSPSRWARAGVSVTIGEAKRAVQFLATLKKKKAMKGRDRVALSDCIENFQDALDNLYKSLFVLRKLTTNDFSSQVDDIDTWVSAALTGEETCIDGVNEAKGKRFKSLKTRVANVTYMTSNALALINKLATGGPQSLIDD